MHQYNLSTNSTEIQSNLAKSLNLGVLKSPLKGFRKKNPEIPLKGIRFQEVLS